MNRLRCNRCGKCGADIIFARTDHGAMMPLDVKLTSVAVVVYDNAVSGEGARVQSIAKGHVPHTCPHLESGTRGES